LIGISLHTAFAQKNLYYRAVSFRHDNDINFFSDKYYTSGIEIKWYSPVLHHSPINNILLPGDTASLVVYAITITHHIYTPEDIFTADIVPNDHPYSSYMLFGEMKEQYNPEKHRKMTSSFQIGVIGPVVGGEIIQNSLHDRITIADPVKGWHNQIQNDLCLQYMAQYEQGLINGKFVGLYSNLQMELGIPQTQAITGLKTRLGLFSPFYSGPETYQSNAWYLYGFTEANLHVVNYNAVLQGGLFNKNNHHVLYNMNHTFWDFRYGGTFVYKNFSATYGVEINSPIFTTALWHRWSEVIFVLAF
jgi:hypothetical protein